jgi:3-oxoacyl-[acyl-carrier-protein] synthase III
MAVPIGILATGGYVPDRVVTNEEICALVPDATPDWILSRTGIVTRRYAPRTRPPRTWRPARPAGPWRRPG